MSRPHKWAELWPNLYPATGTHRCGRCSVLSWADEALAPCPVVTASDAFEALEWVLGLVWRTMATARLLVGGQVRVGVYLVSCGRENGGGYAVEWCGSDYIWTRQRVSGEYEMLAAALDLIERLGS